MRSQPFRSRSVTAPGGSGDLVALSLPAGEAWGIVIDNPSGSWLFVDAATDFVPPYTIQWARTFPWRVANVSVRYVNGPAGQVSTQDGDPMTVWLDSEPVGSSAGSATPGSQFIEGFTLSESVDSGNLAVQTTVGLSVIGLIPAVAGTRIRLLNLSVRSLTDDAGFADNINGIAECVVEFTDTGIGSARVFVQSLVTAEDPSWHENLYPGVDFGVGLRVDFTAGPAIAQDARLRAWAHFQRI